MDAGILPICGVGDVSIFHRMVVNVIDVALAVDVLGDLVFPTDLVGWALPTLHLLSESQLRHEQCHEGQNCCDETQTPNHDFVLTNAAWPQPRLQ